MDTKKVRGFTLIELLIAVAVIGVIAAIATPFYLKYGVRAKRTDVQTAMVQIAQKLQAYKLANNDYGAANTTYTTNTLLNPAIYGGTTFPLGSTGSRVLYNLTLTPATPSDTWRLDAAGANTQATNGTNSLNDQGWKCWNNPNGNTTNACVSGAPTVNTTWDGK